MLTILIVDDEEINQEILIKYLEEFNYDIRTANDGSEAWTMLESEPDVFDIILLDRVMPNMDGMEVLTRVKANDTLKNIPVILQTSMAAPDEIAEGIQAGAFYYLVKPYDKKVLLSVIETASNDRQRYLALLAESRRTTLISTLTMSGQFTLRTLEEASALAAFLANACPNPQSSLIGFSELLVNAVEHGNLAITYEEKSELKKNNNWEKEVTHRLSLPEYADKQVMVDFDRNPERIQAKITDEGKGFDWEQYLEFNPERAMDTHGRGIAMAKALSFDAVKYKGCGNEVLITIDIQNT